MIEPAGQRRSSGPERGQATAELQPRVQAPPRYLSDTQRRWLADLYRSDFPRVFRLCRRVLGNREDAADAAHQTFLKAIDSFPPGSAHRDVSPWLLTVARNHCIDELRSRKRLGNAMMDLAADGHGDGDPERPVMDRQVVAAVFRQLRARERQALWKSAVEQRSLAEIATELRLSYMAAAQLLHRAKRRAHLLAMRLIALIGLLQAGRLAKRATLKATQLLSALRQAHPESSTLGAHHLLAVLAVPLVLATVQTSSSAPPTPRTPSVPPANAVLAAPATLVPGGAVLKAEGTQETISIIETTLPVPPTGAVVLPPLPLPVPTPALGSTVSSLQRSVQNLTTGTIPDLVGGILGPRHL